MEQQDQGQTKKSRPWLERPQGVGGMFAAKGETKLDPRVTSLRLPTEQMEQFIAIAQERGLTRGELVREVVMEWLSGQE
ncbi:CopG family transcriptional regulator [Leptolyngbya sp. Heron Island J]|uniref:ribbon-helix-helix domain-containing protein n=1 Tax=Leptolyngbya sp. Heron Island J TaxID=1385935 RepID=UPI0004282F8D|nr:CopG family transcriptional regulator [Leptolyngbya sp. Heron Island J]